MLNSDSYTILKKDPSTDHFKAVKINVKISVLFRDQTKRMVISSSTNCVRIYAQPKINAKASLAF